MAVVKSLEVAESRGTMEMTDQLTRGEHFCNANGNIQPERLN